MFQWNGDPIALQLGPLSMRWYGLLFGTGFLIGHRYVRKIFAMEGKPVVKVDTLFIYMFIGTIVGARLGHCIFYEPDIYLSEPLRILKIWEGGLASHGAMVGIIASYWLYCRKNKEYSILQILDRCCIPAALGGAFIRVGNFMNSEIIGKETDVPWAVTFMRLDRIPRHPAQLYEAIAYVVLFVILSWLFFKTKIKEVPGRIFGILLIWIFTARFLLEFLKENQVDFESDLPINMGQILSLPFVIAGVLLVLKKNPPKPELERVNQKSKK